MYVQHSVTVMCGCTSGTRHSGTSLLGSDVTLVSAETTLEGWWAGVRSVHTTDYHILFLSVFRVQNGLQSLCKWRYTYTEKGSVKSIFFSDRKHLFVFLWYMFVADTGSFTSSENILKLKCFNLPIILALSLSFTHVVIWSVCRICNTFCFVGYVWTIVLLKLFCIKRTLY